MLCLSLWVLLNQLPNFLGPVVSQYIVYMNLASVRTVRILAQHHSGTMITLFSHFYTRYAY